MNRPWLRIGVAALATAVILAAVNLSIAGKERLLESGRVVYLELAPVDPRSIMQGDYMALNYAIAADVRRALPRAMGDRGGVPQLVSADGLVVATLDDRSVAHFARLDDGHPLAGNEVRLRYRVRGERLRFASNAFFFQEGTAERYRSAHYGRFRVDESGDMLLTALHDKNLVALGSTAY